VIQAVLVAEFDRERTFSLPHPQRSLDSASEYRENDWRDEPTPEDWVWIRENRRLLIVMSRRLAPVATRNLTDSEILSVVYPFVVRSLRRWTEDGGANRATFATGILKTYWINRGHLPRRLKFFPVGSRGGSVRVPRNPVLFGDRTPEEVLAEKQEDDLEFRLAAMRAFRDLSDRHQSVVARYLGLFGPAETLAQIGETEGVSRERVRQLIDRGLDILRKRLDVREPTEKRGRGSETGRGIVRPKMSDETRARMSESQRRWRREKAESAA